MNAFGATWLGYLRPDGALGIRNKALVVYTCGCASHVARAIAAQRDPGLVDVIGCQGCAHSPDMERKLCALALHQNVGAVLVVGNGCEPISAQAICQQALDAGRPADWTTVHKAGSVAGAVAQGGARLDRLLQALPCAPRAPMGMGDLVIGAECGGSDFTSGLAANPLVGSFFDQMVDLGATVMFEEMYECVGLRDYLVARCVDDGAKARMGKAYDRYFAHSVDSGQFYISPGNVRGGLTTIEEKSMGAVVKSGTRPISGLLRPCQRPPHPGLWMMDGMGDDEYGCGFAVSNDASSTLLYLTCGAHMTILTSGRGHLANNPVGPTLKITGNARTYQTLHRDMDLDASGLLDGSATVAQLTQALARTVAWVCGGQPTKGEALGHREAVMYYEKIEGVCTHGR